MWKNKRLGNHNMFKKKKKRFTKSVFNCILLIMLTKGLLRLKIRGSITEFISFVKSHQASGS